jgi:hypothetical protein
MNYNKVKKYICNLDFDYLLVVEYKIPIYNSSFGRAKHPTLISALKHLIKLRKDGDECEVIVRVEGMYYLYDPKTYSVFATQKEMDHYAKLGRNYVDLD